MWTRNAVSRRHLAIPTKNSITVFWITAPFQISVHRRPGPSPLTMLLTIVIDMLNRQKYKPIFAAAGTLSAISINHFLLQFNSVSASLFLDQLRVIFPITSCPHESFEPMLLVLTSLIFPAFSRIFSTPTPLIYQPVFCFHQRSEQNANETGVYSLSWLPQLGTIQQIPDPKSGVLPITPCGNKSGTPDRA